MSLLRPIVLAAVCSILSAPAFAMRDGQAKPTGAETIAVMEAQAASWGATLRDARQIAGCKPNSEAWLQSVSQSVQSEMDAEISQLRQLSSEDGAAFAAREVKIRAWVASQAALASRSKCKA